MCVSVNDDVFVLNLNLRRTLTESGCPVTHYDIIINFSLIKVNATHLIRLRHLILLYI